MARKVIFKARVGSHLYGTNRPDSDEDFLGVFLPSTEDLLGLQECPREYTENKKLSDSDRNTKGDIDCKYFSVKQFLKLAAEGQSIALELFFVPPEQILIAEAEWYQIKVMSSIIFSRQGIKPFIGFALAQAHKATVKGENLNQIKDLIIWGENLEKHSLQEPISSFMKVNAIGSGTVRIVNTDIDVKIFKNDHGFLNIEIAGRKYDINLKTKTFINNIKELEGRYGSRSQAAAEGGYDYKSLSHAYRLLSEAKEFLSTGYISFPRPDAVFLKSVRSGEYDADYFDEINKGIDEIRQKIEPLSQLPNHPNRSKINDLCCALHYNHLFNKENDNEENA